jgi:hypothetical protein
MSAKAEAAAAVAALDLEKLAKLLGMVGSAHAGERENAIRLADRMLRDAGMGWPDLLAPFHKLDIATEAARQLLAENLSLKAELDQLHSSGTAIAAWAEVPAERAVSCAIAEWALDLHRRKLVSLSNWEVGFLNRCTTWVGRLTPAEQPQFRPIIDRIINRTGRQPPA